MKNCIQYYDITVNWCIKYSWKIKIKSIKSIKKIPHLCPNWLHRLIFLIANRHDAHLRRSSLVYHESQPQARPNLVCLWGKPFGLWLPRRGCSKWWSFQQRWLERDHLTRAAKRHTAVYLAGEEVLWTNFLQAQIRPQILTKRPRLDWKKVKLMCFLNGNKIWNFWLFLVDK